MTPVVIAALGRYLLTLADDELVLGYRDSEWTAVAPMVEEDVAFSSLAQDEIGHARLYYILAAELLEADPDHLALLRPKEEYYHARLLEARTTPRYEPTGEHQRGGDWSKAVVRRYLYDRFDDLRTAALLDSGYAPLAGAVQKIRREEQYHLRHGQTWLATLARSSDDARARLEATLDTLWPDLLGLFEETPDEALLCDEGVLSRRTSELRDPWLAQVQEEFAALDLPFPGERTAEGWRLAVEPATGGRLGQHGPGWDELYDDMTMVRRLEPDGVW